MLLLVLTLFLFILRPTSLGNIFNPTHLYSLLQLHQKFNTRTYSINVIKRLFSDLSKFHIDNSVIMSPAMAIMRGQKNLNDVE